jgi:hypothetical protein
VKRFYYRFTPLSSRIYACPARSAKNCKGGTNAGELSCIDGAFGPLCELCREKYYLEMATNSCERCADAAKGATVITIFVILGLMLLVVAFLKLVVASNYKALSTFYVKHKRRITYIGIKGTAFIVTMQVIILMNTSHEDLDGRPLPLIYRNFLTFMSFLAMDVLKIIPAACIFGRINHLRRLLVWTLVPTWFILTVALVMCSTKKPERRKAVSVLCENSFLVHHP